MSGQIRRIIQRCLLDHLIRLRVKLRRERKGKRLSRLQVDDQLELRWLFYGKICRLSALEDLAYVGGYSTTSFIRLGTSGKFTT